MENADLSYLLKGKMKRRRCRKFRNIAFNSDFLCFKPCGIPMKELETVFLEADEIEAIRLMDNEGLYQQEASERMNISRTTLSRTVERARNKISDAIINGKGLIINKAVNGEIEGKNEKY